MPPRAGLLTLAILLLAAVPARAAEFDVTAFELTPSSTAAGAHADVAIAMRDSDGFRPAVTLKVRPRR